MIRTLIAYLRLRWRWTYDADHGTWHRGTALIEDGNHGFLLYRPGLGYTIRASLTEAMQAEAEAEG